MIKILIIFIIVISFYYCGPHGSLTLFNFPSGTQTTEVLTHASTVHDAPSSDNPLTLQEVWQSKWIATKWDKSTGAVSIFYYGNYNHQPKSLRDVYKYKHKY